MQVKQAMIEELRRGPRLLPAEQRSVDDAAAALEQEAQELLVSAGGADVPARNVWQHGTQVNSSKLC